MKIVLVGGGGVRAPLFVRALARRTDVLGPTSLVLHDVDSNRLRLFGGLAVASARPWAGALEVTTTSVLEEAIDGADHVITSIRAGGDAGRVRDERIALEHGVLGQETVGAGGFAMAARSWAALEGVARLVAERAPRAWTLHFTNPAGLVAQMLVDAGYERHLGICDSPSDLIRRVLARAGSEAATARPHVAGLNHVSWLVALERASGDDLLPALLADDAFLAAVAAPFDPARVRAMRALPSEYLYYYEAPQRALAAQRARGSTRGVDITDANRALEHELAAIDPTGRFESTFDEAHACHRRYTERREASYRAQIGRVDDDAHGDSSEGYAGIALDILGALEEPTDAPREAIVSMRGAGALPFLEDDDVIETTARIDRSGPRPVPAPALAAPVVELVRAVKRYERLASRAIREHSRTLACEALTAHPLVASEAVAGRLVDAYAAAHAAHIPAFR